MAITIREHRPGGDVDDFLRAAHVVFQDDPAWVAPLQMDMKERLDPEKNPFFEHGEAALFTAWKGDELVGRCSAQIDRAHLERYRDDTGFFGFLDTVNDPAVSAALLERAEEWLRDRGMKRIRGPLSLNIWEEVGVLVEGFEHPPVMLMGHSRDWQAGLIEQAGFAKAKDFYAWKYITAEGFPKRAQRAWDDIQALPEVQFRTMRKSDLDQEVPIIMDIFNDAWSANWGYVQATQKEVEKTAKDLKLILDERMAFVADVDGRPMAMCICLPNVNEAIADLDGKLLPTGLFKLLWRLKVKKPRSARLMLLGIRSELRGVKRYGGLALALCVEVAKRGHAAGYEWAELSWTLEDNAPINVGIRAMGARIYKKYRVYEKPIGARATQEVSS
ncbi:MAG: hypothetical protein ACOC9T_03095 [Myxococcota bacterium]